ncbi:MAG: mechanosensitive ion channel domain-containing protein [bacterium]
MNFGRTYKSGKLLGLVILGIFIFCFTYPALAQNAPSAPASNAPSAAPATPDTGATPVVAEPIPEGLTTPRKCFEKYRDAMLKAASGDSGAIATAAECLDLSEINSLIKPERGKELVILLARILDYSEPVKPEKISDKPTGPPVTIIEHSEGDIVIGQDSQGTWRFTKETVAAIPGIFRAMELAGTFQKPVLSVEPEKQLSGGKIGERIALRELIPPGWKNRTFLLEDWHWFLLVSIILLFFIIHWILTKVTRKAVAIWLNSFEITGRERLMSGSGKPVGLLVGGLFAWWAIGLPGFDDWLLNFLLPLIKLIVAFGVAWCFFKATDIVSAFLEYRSAIKGMPADKLLVPFIRKAIKVILLILVIIVVLSNAGLNVMGLVAGLGIGGLAIALAAKDPLENLFGSIVVLFDRPFQVGDHIVMDNLEGTVEEVGLRSTRIKTFYNSLVIVPNAVLMTARIENMGVRQYRRIRMTLSVTYDTPPEKIEAFCVGIREIIETHPLTRKEFYHVWFYEFNESSLDVLVQYHLETADYTTELHERHRIFLTFIRLANELGVEFAFPSRTIYMASEKENSGVNIPSNAVDSVTKTDMAVEAKKIARRLLEEDFEKEKAVSERDPDLQGKTKS